MASENYLYNKKTTRRERMETFNLYVLPVAMHGCECWVYRTGQGGGRDLEKETIRKWHMRYIRRMAGVGIAQQIADHITDESIMTNHKQLPLVLRCEAKQWRFARHVYRASRGLRWSKFILAAKLAEDPGNATGQKDTWQKRIRRLGDQMHTRFPQGHATPFQWDIAKNADDGLWMKLFWDYHDVPANLRPGTQKIQNSQHAHANNNGASGGGAGS